MDEIKCFINTKKSLSLIHNKKYSFLIDRNINKMQLKKSIEFFFGIKVLMINVLNLSKKKKINKYNFYYKKLYKKAIITISVTDCIFLFSNI